MINNIGKTSSVIRLTLGLSILTLCLTEVLSGTFGTVSFAVAGILLVSGIFRTDPVKFMAQRIKHKNF